MCAHGRNYLNQAQSGAKLLRHRVSEEWDTFLSSSTPTTPLYQAISAGSAAFILSNVLPSEASPSSAFWSAARNTLHLGVDELIEKGFYVERDYEHQNESEYLQELAALELAWREVLEEERVPA